LEQVAKVFASRADKLYYYANGHEESGGAIKEVRVPWEVAAAATGKAGTDTS
jgi:hypothetical protein